MPVCCVYLDTAKQLPVRPCAGKPQILPGWLLVSWSCKQVKKMHGNIEGHCPVVLSCIVNTAIVDRMDVKGSWQLAGNRLLQAPAFSQQRTHNKDLFGTSLHTPTSCLKIWLLMLIRPRRVISIFAWKLAHLSPVQFPKRQKSIPLWAGMPKVSLLVCVRVEPCWHETHNIKLQWLKTNNNWNRKSH